MDKYGRTIKDDRGVPTGMTCLVCGFGLDRAHGRTYSSGQVAMGQIDGKDFGFHLGCLRGGDLTFPLQRLLGLVDDDERPTARGREVWGS